MITTMEGFTKWGTFLVVLLLSVARISSLQVNNSTNVPIVHHHHEPQCERITVEDCQGLGYNMTAMPNLVGHASQAEAESLIKSLEPILEASSECSKQARFLICATIFPLCSPDMSRPVPACRNLCESVKRDCNVHAELEFLDCNILPQPDKLELCMKIPNPEKDSTSHFPVEIPTHPNLNKHPGWPWLSWNLPPNHKVSSVTTCPINFTLFLDECVPQCRTDAIFSSHQKKVAETWILGLAVLCFLFTLISLVTFWTETTRFGFPERPVLFLTLCYNLLSICYLERIIFHNRNLELYEFDEMISIGACEINPPCLASYITTSYLTLSAACWWLIFGLCWYLSTEKQWSSEALEKKSGIFHVLAWVPPLVPPIAALLFGAVKPHELTGLCTASGYTEIPALILLVTGGIFIILAAKSLKNLQFSCNYEKLSQMMNRILLFGMIYFIPAMIAIILTFVENRFYNLKKYPPCQPGDVCQPPEKLTIGLSLTRLFFILFGGSLTGIWVWSRKTCNSCRSRIAMNNYPHNMQFGADGQIVTTRQGLLEGTLINGQTQIVQQSPNGRFQNGRFSRSGNAFNCTKYSHGNLNKFGSKTNGFLGASVPISAGRQHGYFYSEALSNNSNPATSPLFPGIHFQSRINSNGHSRV